MKAYIPHKELRYRPTDAAWWTPECTAAIQARRAAWKRLQLDRQLHSSQVDYNLASLLATSTIAQARQRHMTRLRQRISIGALRGKQWWSAVKRAGGHSRNREVPVVVDQNRGQHSTNKAKAECLGQFFSKKCSLGDEDFSDGVFPHVRSRTEKQLLNVHFRIPTVCRARRQLDPSKATGPDGILASLLKSCADELAPPLSKLFSLCFRCGAQPQVWKVAQVVPVHKKSSKSQAKNYRPISLRSIGSKVM